MLPKKINLGCGNVILVKEVERSVIIAAAGTDTEAFWTTDANPDGQFVGTIMIDRSLPGKHKVYLLYHELVHATNDISAWERDRI